MSTLTRRRFLEISAGTFGAARRNVVTGTESCWPDSTPAGDPIATLMTST